MWKTASDLHIIIALTDLPLPHFGAAREESSSIPFTLIIVMLNDLAAS